MPGCIAATPVDNTCVSVESGIRSAVPIVYFHGDTSPKNKELFKSLLGGLSKAIDRFFSFFLCCAIVYSSFE